MAHVSEVTSVDAFRFEGAAGAMLLVHASGGVATSGWSGIRLSPRFYPLPPADGLWEFDFQGDPPTGLVLDVILSASATALFGVPAWFRGVKVYAAHDCATVEDVKTVAQIRNSPSQLALAARAGAAMLRHDLVSLDDSHAAVGPGRHAGSVRMKRLRHTLTLTVEGPDEARIRRCLAESAGAGLVEGVVAAYPAGGGALTAAVSALLVRLQDYLGDAFGARVDDHSCWIEWCT